MKTILLFASIVVIILPTSLCYGEGWSQFRGPNGSGIASGTDPLPEKIGPETNLLWKTPVAEGISSPVIGDNRVYLTTMEPGAKLSTVALHAKDGQILWQAVAPIYRKPKGKRLASSTPVTDGERVISFFGSAGLFCYDKSGKLQWKKDFGPLINQFNHAASPILVGNRLILVVDHDGDSFVIALDKKTGKELWRSWRFVLGRNYASPVIWKRGDRSYIVVSGSGLITGYEIETGTPAWYVRGTAAVVNPTPIVGSNGWLYAHGSSPTSGAKSSPFSSLLKQFDRNNDAALQKAELPNSFLKAFFSRFDKDTNAGITEQEYGQFRELSRPFVKGMVAFKPEGAQEPTVTHEVWAQTRTMPRTPSALYLDGVIYVVNESGILQSMDAKSGKVIHKGRIDAKGTIYASLASGDGKIYVGTRNGTIGVISARPNWTNLHTAQLDGEIQASPAIEKGHIYFRTAKALYCFGLPRNTEKRK